MSSTEDTDMPEVVRSIEISAPPSATWRWLATEEALRAWLGSNLEIDLQVGGAYRVSGPDERTWVNGRVLEFVPEGRLVLSWLEEGSDWVHPARLVISLAPTTAGTRVTQTYDGLAGIGKPTWPDTVKGYERGVDRHRILEQLAEVVVDESA
jgi:uncharacterized protein YndB with AHSA1/START domain